MHSTLALAALPLRGLAAAPAPVSTLLVVGDSLSAEYGLARGAGWVQIVADRIAKASLPWQVVNASVSGETTAGGRSRLPALIERHRPQAVIFELGANDALRGLPVATARDNLQTMVRAAKAAGARVLVAGMQVPPNYGRRYTEDFAAMFATVAKAEGAALVPFLLAGVADAPEAERLFQGDGLHPVAAAQPRLADNVWPALAPLLR